MLEDQKAIDQFDQLIQQASAKYGVPAELIKLVIQHESSGNPKATSPAGARGLMQVMPQYVAIPGITDLYDPAQNIMAGTAELAGYLKQYKGNVPLALAAYNGGPTRLAQRGYDISQMPQETQNYVKNITSAYQPQDTTTATPEATKATPLLSSNQEVMRALSGGSEGLDRQLTQANVSSPSYSPVDTSMYNLNFQQPTQRQVQDAQLQRQPYANPALDTLLSGVYKHKSLDPLPLNLDQYGLQDLMTRLL